MGVVPHPPSRSPPWQSRIENVTHALPAPKFQPWPPQPGAFPLLFTPRSRCTWVTSPWAGEMSGSGPRGHGRHLTPSLRVA